MRKLVPIAMAVLAVVALVPDIAMAADDAFEALLKSVERADPCKTDINCAACYMNPECVRQYKLESQRREAAGRAAAAAAQKAATQKQKAAAAAQNATAQKLGREPKTIRVGDTSEYVELQWGRPERVDRMASAYAWTSGGGMEVPTPFIS